MTTCGNATISDHKKTRERDTEHRQTQLKQNTSPLFPRKKVEKDTKKYITKQGPKTEYISLHTIRAITNNEIATFDDRKLV